MKDRLVSVLHAVRLARPAYGLYELAKAFPPERGQVAPDGLAIPPRRLRLQVAGTTDRTWFLESGRRSAETISETLSRFGLPITRSTALLDFGCGCGRVARHWPTLGGGAVYGTDQNERAVDWCARNLSFAAFSRNKLVPPLTIEDERFDAAYAISVLTHLPDQLVRAWLEELARVLRHGGLLVLTTHGDAYLRRLTPDERERYQAGLSVVRRERIAGTNLCTAFHPAAFVETQFTRHFELLTHVPDGASAGTVHHDLVVLRRP